MLTLNCWGLKYVSKLRKERFRAIAEYLTQYPGSSYDVIFLQVVNNNVLHHKFDKIKLHISPDNLSNDWRRWFMLIPLTEGFIQMKTEKYYPLTHGWFSDPYFKVLWEGVTTFLFYFFHLGIRNKRFCKVKNFQVWVA